LTTRKYFGRDEWPKRVDPVFVRYWIGVKRMRALSGSGRSQEEQAAYRKNELELATASREIRHDPSSISARFWPALFAGLDGEGTFSGTAAKTTYITSPESSAVFRELVFLRHGITYRELMVEIETDPSAYTKLMQVHVAFSRFGARKGDLDHPKLKFKLTHLQVMVQGLDFGFEDLNERELTSCFDEICPCAQRHSLEYMKKFRVSVKKACTRVLSSIAKPTSFEAER
jgi:hypothetical protein